MQSGDFADVRGSWALGLPHGLVRYAPHAAGDCGVLPWWWLRGVMVMGAMPTSRAERGAQELDVVPLVAGDLLGVEPDLLGAEVDLPAANDRTAVTLAGSRSHRRSAPPPRHLGTADPEGGSVGDRVRV